MSLPVAWGVAGIGVPLLLLGLAFVAGDSAYGQQVYFALVIAPVLLTPVLAHGKRRRPWLWGIIALGAASLQVLLFSLTPLIQPVTVLVAIALARPPGQGGGVPAANQRVAVEVVEEPAVEEEHGPLALPPGEPAPPDGTGQTEERWPPPAAKPFRPRRPRRR